MKKAAFLTVVLLISACAYGQGGGNAAITGTVTDPSDAVVPGATVIVTQEGTGVTRSAVANASGQFSVPSLLPSDYTVSVEAAGFKKSVQRFTLLADQIRELKRTMEGSQPVKEAGSARAVSYRPSRPRQKAAK